MVAPALQTRTIEVVWRQVDQLTPAPFNPAVRTEDNASFRGLVDSIRRLGIENPLTISQDNRIIDGHRRWSAAKQLGIDEVPCIISHLGLQEAWGEHNSNQRPLRKSEWLSAYVGGMAILNVPVKIRELIQEIEQAAGFDMLEHLSSLNRSPDIAKQMVRVAAYCGEENNEFKRKALVWMLDHNMSRPVIEAMKMETSPRVIRRAVLSNRPLVQGYVIGQSHDQ